MGIFSLFGKKVDKPATTPADKDSSRKKRGESSANSELGRAQKVQRSNARATAMKIDAIESEMSSEFVRPGGGSGNTIPGPASMGGNTIAPSRLAPAESQKKPGSRQDNAGFQSTLPLIISTTQFLLGETIPGGASVDIATTPAIEEAAILYANGQTEMAEQILLATREEETARGPALIIWSMLFDLYQVTGREAEFDTLCIEFASKFETSPPSWKPTEIEHQAAPPPSARSTPTVPFSGKLDGNIVKLLERAQNLAEHSKVLRLEFNRVTEVDPIGCGILLSVLKKLQKSDHDLILVGALELSTKVRAILAVGRRDETEAPWLLLMEILRLLNLEKEFEEASIDYCVTFEVSPPAFVAPKNKVITALEEALIPDESSENFMMPNVIEGRTDQLIPAITAYISEHNPAILDCSRLTRVDFSATGQLLTGLAPLTASGNMIEMHNVNYLVAALFSVMGMKDIVRVLPRKG